MLRCAVGVVWKLTPPPKCPFRIVDEINQGMDSRNERTVFSQVRVGVGCVV